MSTKPCPLFVELCCGSAAVTLRLIGGPNARPPISYMGAKTGYAQAILHVLGLRSGQGADACVLVEAGPWARAWRLLTTPQGCRAVAEVIRGWIGEDARALWERLRAEGAADGEGAEGVGAWLWVAANGLHGSAFKKAPEGISSECNLSATGLAKVIAGPPAQNRWACAPLSALAWPPTQTIEGDVVGVEPRDVAAWLYLQQRSAWSKGPAAGFKPETRDCSGWAPTSNPGTADNPRPVMADHCEALAAVPWPPTTIASADVAQVQPGTLPSGTVAYFDPPYQNTTGYAHGLTRAQVLDVARRWSDAGAVVCVSEAEPLPLDGWHHVEITGCRVGQKRTFSKQKREWLTLNRAPAWTPATQGDLF